MTPRLLLAVLLALPSCASVPRHAVSASGITVRGDDAEQIRAHLDDFVDVRDRVAAVLPATSGADFDVWIVDSFVDDEGTEARYVGGAADTLAGRVYMPRDDADDLTTYAHELVHVLLDDSWDDELPLMIEEGLADHVAYAVVGVSESERRYRDACAWLACRGGVGRFVDDTTGETIAEVALAFDPPATLDEFGAIGQLRHGEDLDVARMVALYALGRVVVDRIVERSGYEGVRAVVLEHDGEPPLDAFVAAAGLPRDLALWPDAVLAPDVFEQLEALADFAFTEGAVRDSDFFDVTVGLDGSYVVWQVPSVRWMVDGIAHSISLGSGQDVASREAAQRMVSRSHLLR